jgi:ABC-type cobalamin/Fe3+-siderophores transport system ATPase subunit
VAMGSPEQVMTPAHLRAAFDAEIEVATHARTGRPHFVPRSES